jgi:hypothetical protein
MRATQCSTRLARRVRSAWDLKHEIGYHGEGFGQGQTDSRLSGPSFPL